MRYGYARVSTKGQAREGTSLWAQEEALKNAGCEKIFKEAYTGKTMDRPMMDALMSEAKEGDEIYVTKLDRLARNTVEGIQFIDRIIEKGCSLRVMNMGTFDSTPVGKLMRTMLLAFAEYEREVIVERCMAGREEARKRPGYVEGGIKKTSHSEIQKLLDKGLTRQQIMKKLKISRGCYYATLKRDD